MYSIAHEAARSSRLRGVATFQNPIAPGADPWVVFHQGYYYWCASDFDLGVAVYRSKSLTKLGRKSVVWRAPQRGPYCAQVWAPELHRLDGRWYIYVAASDGQNDNHRMIVLEAEGDDPTRPFHFKAELYTGDDFAGRTQNRWAIDGTILELHGRRYCVWSGWEDERDVQSLYIAPMANPWTLSAARVKLCANDDFVWERVGEDLAQRGLNEGPQVLQRNGRTFIVYSCSGSWEPTYKLGRLELDRNGDPLDPRSWAKACRPVFEPTARTFGIGHCSFTPSPDGTEDWIVYHAKVSRAHGWQRVVQAQRFTWSSSGQPQFGRPVEAIMPLPVPSGDQAEAITTVRRAVGDLLADVSVTTTAGETSGEALAAG